MSVRKRKEMNRMAFVEARLRIRRAQPGEADSLTALITRSKAYWGYGAILLEAWRAALTLDSDTIAQHPVNCVEDATSGEALGVSHGYRLNEEEFYLDHLFV